MKIKFIKIQTEGKIFAKETLLKKNRDDVKELDGEFLVSAISCLAAKKTHMGRLLCIEHCAKARKAFE